MKGLEVRQDWSIDYATKYAVDVLDGDIVAGPYVRAACERHISDMERQGTPDFPYFWDMRRANRVIRFFQEVLCLPDGELAGKPFVLAPWQCFVQGSLFGWVDSDGWRRFRVSYVEIGKGNGKSPMAAGTGHYMFVADGEQGAEIYAAAVTRDQARIMYRDAAKMKDASDDLSRAIVTSGRKEVYNMAHPRSGSFFRPISSEGRALDGKRVHCGLVDEVHEHPTDVVVEKMRAGTKGRRQALIYMITNSGYDKNTICGVQHDHGIGIIRRERIDESRFVYIASLDEGEDPLEDERCWIKSNPNLGISITEQYLREQVSEARAMPTKRGLVLRLNFCVWTDAVNPWIASAVWRWVQVAPQDLRVLENHPELDPYIGADCYLSLDLSLVKDLTAMAQIFVPRPGEDTPRVRMRFWTPAQTVRAREKTDKVPYTVWAEQGHLVLTPGWVVKYSFVAEQLRWISEHYNVLGVAFDEYRMETLQAELEDINVWLPMTNHPQGYRRNPDSNLWMPQSIEWMEGMIGNREVEFEENPVMNWCVSSVTTESDAQGNVKFTKMKSVGRIDGAVAAAMAIGIYRNSFEGEGGPSVYEKRGILEFEY